MVNRGWLCGLVGILCLGMAGCWDRVEIEERGFVVGIAIDNAQDQQGQTADLSDQAESLRKVRYVVTYQFVNPEGMQGGGKSSGGKGPGNGESSGQPMFNISTEGKTLLEASRDMVTKASRTPYIEHLKMIIISERIAKEGHLGPVLDLYLRDNEARRGTKVFVSQGDPRKVLEVDPQNEKLPVLFIDSIAGNVRKNGKMLQKARIGDVHGILLTNESFALPRISAQNNQVDLTGSVVIHGSMNRMVGALDAQETETLNYLTGQTKSDVFEVPMKEGLVSYENKHLKRKVTAKVKDPKQIAFTIELYSDGVVGDSLADYSYVKQTVIEEIERTAAELLENRSKRLIDKLQHQYKADILGLDKHLHHFHPQTWNRIKKDWDYGDNFFSSSDIQVKASVKIREFGAIHKVEKYRAGGMK